MENVRINISKAKASPRKKRAGKAVRILKKEVERRTGVSDVRITNGLNEKIWEKGGKPPKMLDVQFLEEEDYLLVGLAEADLEKRTEEPVEEKVEEETEGTEEIEEVEEIEEKEEETYDLSEEVIEVFKEGTIAQGKEKVKEMNKADFEKLLNFEKAHQNRKGMKKFLRSNMR